MPVVTAENLWPGQPGWEWRDLSTSTTTQGKCLSPTVFDDVCVEFNGPCACDVAVYVRRVKDLSLDD